MYTKELKDNLMIIAEKLDYYGDSISGDIVAYAADCIDSLRGRLAERAAEVERLREAQRWVPADIHPKKDGKYLAATEAGVCILIYAKDREKVCKYDMKNKGQGFYYFDDEWGYIAMNNVTHWMPLSEPPEEGEAE